MPPPPPPPIANEFQEMVAERPLLGARLGSAIQRLADAQFGVVSRAQLRDIGLGAGAISRWTRNGRLQRLHPSVYAVGHRRIQPDGWRMAALLTTGPGSDLAHWSALAVVGLARERGTVHVISATRRGTTAKGVRVHRTVLDPSERTTFDGFPITTAERSIVDVCAEASDRQLGQLLDDAMRRGLYDHRRMLLAIDRAHGRRGIGRLATAVALLGDEGVLFRSGTERAVRDRLVQAGVRRPLVNVPKDKGDGSHHELDLFWPDLQLNVEIDGPHHLMPHQMAADAQRDAWLRARGVRVARFPTSRIDREFAAVVEEIRDLVETCSKK
jgi:hypothetical protein